MDQQDAKTAQQAEDEIPTAQAFIDSIFDQRYIRYLMKFKDMLSHIANPRLRLDLGVVECDRTRKRLIAHFIRKGYKIILADCNRIFIDLQEGPPPYSK